MAVRSVVVNTLDVERAVAFYRDLLDARLIGEATRHGADLDLVTATLHLRALGARGKASTWDPDDLQRGFRHIGLKVDRVDPYAERLADAGVPFHLKPLDAVGGVRITFFYDPDGTLLELVEGDVQYSDVLDAEAVAAERALGPPERPRFDHVALTVADAQAAGERYRPLGFRPAGALEQPQDSRGFRITYLHASGPGVLEVFTYSAQTHLRRPQLEAPGFQAVVLTESVESLDGFTEMCGSWELDRLGLDGLALYIDDDGLIVGVER
ncbi:VOC family protein [Georgenia deserti]|uniref:VOC family protein n=1 Tax=Georgenia deserti TaxID=2093781 RepID=A0ABW4L310_9MICO